VQDDPDKETYETHATVTLSLCASLIVHGLLCVVMIQQYVRGARSIYLPSTVQRVAVAISTPDGTPLFGTNAGKSNSPNEATGEEALRATFAPHDQAWLSRDPAGPGKIGPPTMNLVPPVDGAPAAAPQQTARAIVAPQPESAKPFGPTRQLVDLAAPYKVRAARPVAPPAPPAVAAAAKSNAPAADPAPMSDSESDPFSTERSVDMSPGKVEPHLGRKVKTVRPDIDYVGEVDLFQSQFPKMTLRVRLDASGKPAEVKIVHSTGSTNLDQAVKVAVYKWEFEPLQAATKPAQDIVEFTINWR
jgi:TonB family protein